jgi:S-adenosylhomocysteine hydrolase
VAFVINEKLDFKPAMYELPKGSDMQIAIAKLEMMGLKIYKWKPEQEAYAEET